MIKITEVPRYDIGEVANYEGGEPRLEVGMEERPAGQYILADVALAREAVLQEELKNLQERFDRTELALNGSMKALTRVDNMWKKRWLDKTGEPSTSLIVDEEFKVLFEEIKDYRKRLTTVEQRNAHQQVIIEKLRFRRTKAVLKAEALRKTLLDLKRRLYGVLSDRTVSPGCDHFGCDEWAVAGDRCKKHSPKPGVAQ